MTAANGGAGRIDWIDVARGIGIVLVVIGHVEGGLVDAGLQSAASWAWPSYAIYSFHMPLFFVLAGLNVPHSLAKGAGRFLRSKLWTIAYPYVLWSLIQGSVLVAASSLTNGQAHGSDLLSIGWHPLGQFWFLYVLLVCQLAALLLGARPFLLASVAAAAFLAGAALPQGGIVEELLHSFPFFAAGILLSRRILAARPAWGVAAAALLPVAALLSGPLDGMNYDAPLALPGAVCGIVLTVALAKVLAGPVSRLFAGLGRLSMSIYVMHVLAAAGTRIVLLKLHVPAVPALYLAACTAAGIGAPVVAHLVFARLGLSAALGLAPPRAHRRATQIGPARQPAMESQSH